MCLKILLAYHPPYRGVRVWLLSGLVFGLVWRFGAWNGLGTIFVTMVDSHKHAGQSPRGWRGVENLGLVLLNWADFGLFSAVSVLFGSL